MIKKEILKTRNDILLFLAYLGISKFNDTVIFKETKTVVDLDSLVLEEQVRFKEVLINFGKNVALAEFQGLINQVKPHTEVITIKDILEGRLLWEDTVKLFHVPVYQFIFSRLYKERTLIAKEMFKRATKKADNIEGK